MRADIAPGGLFPNYELTDHTKTLRRMSDLQGNEPMVLVLARGHFCPKDHQQHVELAAFYPKISVAYTQIVTISTDDIIETREFRASVGAQWTFLSDPDRQVQKDLDIQEYTDPYNDPMIPHTLVLKPGLVIHRVYNGYWFWGRPSVEDLRHDLREATRQIRPDWDLSAPGLRAAWDAGDHSSFYPDPDVHPVWTRGYYRLRRAARNANLTGVPVGRPRCATRNQARPRQKGTLMPRVTVGRENSADIEIHYEDHGSGQPVVLIHGYPLSGRAWDKQIPVLLEAGYRVITYDRRGFGQSSQPTTGYDYDTFASDLSRLLETLDLTDVTLVGHSMGTGEVTRYVSAYGSARVAKGVLVSPIPPFLLQTSDNPDGVPQSLFDGFVQAARSDTPAWMKGFLDNFYNVDSLRGTLVSDQAYQASWNIAATASATAAVACIPTWTTDFRADLPKIDVPILVVQGDADQVLPLDKTGKRLPGLINDLQLEVVEGGPHAIPWTHADQVNTALLAFLRS